MTTLTDRLRADLWPLVGNRPVGQVARAMGISRYTLWRFMDGYSVNSDSLDAIERWVRAELLRKALEGAQT